ncbi:MAG: hypothetical protein EA394_10390 [Bacteroidia bacterium]|nr:MAG: hypothetical protein EA394_10390 [Bacteroidia bacterium]
MLYLYIKNLPDILKKKNTLWLWLWLLALLAGCASSIRYANRFVIEETNLHILVLPPASLLKTYSPEHPDSLSPHELRETDMGEAKFLDQINDSLFIDRFIQSLKVHLELLYINYYGPEDAEAFFALEDPAYVFTLAQMELIEYRDEEIFIGRSGFDRYIGKAEITVVENNQWFEFYKVHDPDFDMQVLFSANATGDYVEGRFVRMSDGRVRFDPTRYPLSLEDLYDLAYNSGQLSAQKIFDHLMNLYVREHMGRQVDGYYRYDMERHQILKTGDPPFIPIEKAEPADGDQD